MRLPRFSPASRPINAPGVFAIDHVLLDFDPAGGDE
jgi:hypothetical protein